ncbi:MAG: hypothetical protein WCD35_06090 [Mycobacteriales bacterium]
MRLFEDEQPRATRSGSDWEQHRTARQPYTGPPQDEVGVLAMSSVVLARSSDVAVALRGVTAYSDGLLLHVVVLFADEQKQEQLDWSLQEYSRSPGRFRLGVQMSDGTRATTGTGDAPPVEAPGLKAALTLQTSAAGPLRWQGDYWLWPVPPPGLLVVGCRWSDRGIDESLVSLDSEVLRAAAATSVPVWRR